jgi:hypothetical protein
LMLRRSARHDGVGDAALRENLGNAAARDTWRAGNGNRDP